MPYNIIKNKDSTYKVVLRDTGKILSKSTTLDKAKKQIKAIEMRKHNEPFSIIDGYIFKKSDKPKYKLKVFYKDKWIYFGANGYEHYFDKTGLLPKKLNHLDKERRRLYLLRASRIKNKEGQLTKDDKNKANYWAINYLW
jgi:uncharacterized protein YdeI (YjbR/CyaY-like superfamily)